MDPLISLTIRNRKAWFAPGEELDCEYQIDRIGPRSIAAVEASVLWSTFGKGDADMGVHYFERRVPEDLPDGDLRELHRFRTRCPDGPLSYEGELLSIRWCVRVRVFPLRGKETSFDLPFRLGQIASPSELAEAGQKQVATRPEPTRSTEETASVEMTVRHDDPNPASDSPTSSSSDANQDGSSPNGSQR
ncbi:MAG TPA: hypothetical protein DCQ98_05225 [Planctomycetaceae bacterium]|nr:hypothetical protein [Planctomycetaceae bacterium]HRF02630.1 hypothetical protein [Pirellulaceae bacterium]